MQVKGLAEADARELVAARGPGKDGGYPDPLSVWRRAGLKPLALEALPRADAYRSHGLARSQARWAVKPLPGGRQKVKPLAFFTAAGTQDRARSESGREGRRV